MNGHKTSSAHDFTTVGSLTDADALLGKYCMYAKVYGERNAGTGYIEDLIRKNFTVRCLQSNNHHHLYEFAQSLGARLPKGIRGKLRNDVIDIDCARILQSDFGWKHGIPPRDTILSAPHRNHTLFVCVAKHPVSWLRSLARRPYNPVEKAPNTLSDLIRYEWPVTKRDNLPGRERINPLDMWNVKNEAYVGLGFIGPKHVAIAYEDVLRDPLLFLKKIGNYLLPKTNDPEWSLPSTKGDHMTFDQYREKYLSGNIFEALSAEDAIFMKSRISAKLMKTLGYEWM